MKNVKHYKKMGTLYKGKSHKMKNGDLHTGVNHTADSVKLFHFKDLSKAVQNKLKKKSNG
jgi:hypothetical protein